MSDAQDNQPVGRGEIPHDLKNAVAEIQHWALFEEQGQSFDKKYFTIVHAWGFANVAIKSALVDSITFISVYLLGGSLIYWLQGHYLIEGTTDIFIWKLKGSPLYWFSKAASFGSLLFSTGLCMYTAQFYVGVVTKKAINMIFMVRALFLMSFSFLMFVCLGFMHKVLSDNVAQDIALMVYRVVPSYAEEIYYFLATFLRRAFFESSIMALVASFVSGVLPFAAILVFKIIKKRQTALGIGNS